MGLRIKHVPIESIRPGNFVLAHDGQPHRVLRAISREHRGEMFGLLREGSSEILWITRDHRVLCAKRPVSFGADNSWRHIPRENFARAREMRREMTLAEQRLWSVLSHEQLGVKFRRQHPVGPYICDFYARDKALVVEVDGGGHYTEDGEAYDLERTMFLEAQGLTVLRFANADVLKNRTGVTQNIYEAVHATEASDIENAEWRIAETLQPGDIAFACETDAEGNSTLWPSRTISIQRESTVERVYDIEVENAHSYLTSVCAIHNCGSAPAGDTLPSSICRLPKAKIRKSAIVSWDCS